MNQRHQSCSHYKSRHENIRSLPVDERNIYTCSIMVLGFLHWSTARFISWPYPEPQSNLFTPAHMSLPGPCGKQRAPSLTKWVVVVGWEGTDVWNDTLVQYHLIVLGLKYEISLQNLSRRKQGMLCECRR